jgi:signal transduction histidine kinase
MVEVISRNGDRLLALADDLLQLATFDHAAWPEQATRVDLRTVLAESGGSIGALLATRDLDVDYAQPDAEVVVNGDPNHLERAVTNLLTNAVKFTPEGGRITIRARAASGCVSIAIADTGIGIPEYALTRLGRPFEQVESQLTKSHQGSGLGLAIAKSLVELHRGSMRIRSTPGRGTMVLLRLPIAGRAMTREDIAEAAA